MNKSLEAWNISDFLGGFPGLCHSGCAKIEFPDLVQTWTPTPSSAEPFRRFSGICVRIHPNEKSGMFLSLPNLVCSMSVEDGPEPVRRSSAYESCRSAI